jgi:uncharacterized protein involved in outer membrane biogenesis
MVGIYVRFDVNQYRTRIQTEMEQRLGRKVVLGNLRLKLIPLRLRVSDLEISEDPAFGRNSPFLKADTVDLSVTLLSLLRNKAEISAMNLERAKVELVKNAKGVWNFSSIGHGTHQTASTTGVLINGDLTIHDGQVAVTSLRTKENRKIYDHIDATLEDFTPGKPFSIDAVAYISSRGGQEISLQGKVGAPSELAPDQWMFDGTLSLKRVAISGLRNFLSTPILARTDGIVSGKTVLKTEDGKQTAVGGVKLENVVINGLNVGYPITAQYNLAEDPATDVVTIVAADVGLGTATVSGSGLINLQSEPAQLDLKVGSKGASMAEVARLASALGVAFEPGTTVTGQMESDLQIRGPFDNPSLNGTVSTRDLRISGNEIPQPVRIASLTLAITPVSIRSNNFEVASGGTTASAHFGVARYTSKSPTIDFALRSTNASLPEVLAMARAYGQKGLAGINGAGTLNLDIHASGPVQSIRSSEIARLLNGNASINLSNVRLTGLDVEHELASLAGLKKSRPDRGGTDIQRLTGHFKVSHGIAQTNDLQAALNIGNAAAAGSADLSSHTLNLRATVVLSKAVSQEVGGPLVGMVLANNRGELVVPGIITGTFESPKFAPDKQQFSLMKLKGIIPTSDNPFGLLGTLFGQNDRKERSQPEQHRSKGIEGVFDKFLGGNKK